MQLLVLLCSFAIWIYALANPELGVGGFFLWFIAFMIIYLTWSNRYAFLSLIASSSYYFSDWHHLNPFYSKVFPFISSITTFILFFALLFKLLEKVSSSVGGHGGGGSSSSDIGGIDIGCGGGCDGGGE